MKFSIKKLIKIGSEENIDKLLNYGDVYMRHFRDFRREELYNFLRGDFAEGLSWTPLPNFRIPKLEGQGLNIKHAYINKDVDSCHIYSMFMLDDNFWNGGKKISEKLIQFGDSALIIEPLPFIERFKMIKDCHFKFGSVKYYKEPLWPSKIDEFSKRSGYEFQNEFRISKKSDDLDPIHIYLGSLKDIGLKIETKSLFSANFLRK